MSIRFPFVGNKPIQQTGEALVFAADDGLLDETGLEAHFFELVKSIFLYGLGGKFKDVKHAQANE